MTESPEDQDMITLQGFLIDTIEEYREIWEPNWLEPLDRAAACQFLTEVRALCTISPLYSTTNEGDSVAAQVAIAANERNMEAMLSGQYAEICCALMASMLPIAVADEKEDNGVSPVSQEAVGTEQRSNLEGTVFHNDKQKPSRKEEMKKRPAIASLVPRIEAPVHEKYARKMISRGTTFRKDKDAIQAFNEELSILKRLNLGPYIESLRLLPARRPFLSSAGRVGLAPPSVQHGDCVCIFLGGKVPYIVRPLSHKSDMFHIIGEAYVHGVMYGEVLEGHTSIHIPINIC